MTWKDWTDRHAVLFLFRKGDGLESLAEWSRTFAAAGLTPDEMIAASEWLIRNPPQYPKDQPKALMAYAWEQRLRARNAADAEGRRGWAKLYDPAACPTCGGSGLVAGLTVVRRNAHGRAWKACVACNCSVGERYRRLRERAGFPILGLCEYEARDPDWRQRGVTPSRQNDNATPPADGLGWEIGGVLRRAKRT